MLTPEGLPLNENVRELGARTTGVVLVTITSGWHLRNFFGTGLYEELRAVSDVRLAVTDALSVAPDLARRGLACSDFLELDEREGKVLRLLRHGRKFVFAACHRISTEAIKREARARGRRRLGGRLAERLLLIFAQPWQIRFLDWMSGLLTRTPYYDKALGELRPDLLLCLSPFDYRDAHLAIAAARQKVRTVAVVPSWDNPTSKGVLSGSYDSVLTWSDHQANEIFRLYPQMKPEQVAVVGVPQFDAYRTENVELRSHELLYDKLGIGRSARICLYATCGEKLFPNEGEVVGHLVDALDQGKLPADLHLVVRCHPNDKYSRFSRFSKHPRVTVWPPSKNPGVTLNEWIPPQDELTWLRRMLVNSAVCINVASTMTLDSIACGTPVINVAYDGETEVEYWQSVRRYYDYSHYGVVTLSGAIPMATSKELLVSQVNSALKDGRRTTAAQDALLRTIVADPVNGAVQATVQRILRELSNWPAEGGSIRPASAALPKATAKRMVS